jgi:hypothetical protein
MATLKTGFLDFQVCPLVNKRKEGAKSIGGGGFTLFSMRILVLYCVTNKNGIIILMNRECLPITLLLEGI